jgi:type VI secretion system protein ImpL
MGALKKFFGDWWVLSILAVLLAVLVFVVLLPLVLGAIRPLWVRLVILAVILAIWGGLALWRVISARRASDALAKSLAEQAGGDGEGQLLAERMREALASLKSASSKRQDYLYSRPWYVIIGPPGAGKTTALVNSGLRFPHSNAALKGVGGTRNLDFWFADEAVLVDTAGRYTSQDSDAERDRDGWRAFLRLLKKNRPLQPINGVLVAIGLDELVGADVAKIDQHAAIVRQRLQELQQELEVAVPVYVMFTKADLIAGFSEFYDDLDVEGRRAVLGSTFPWAHDARFDTAALAGAFDEMAQAVADRTSKRLQEDVDARRRGLILGFPGQISGLKSRVVRLLDGVFPSQASETPAPLRGFYFTSGVQQGTPLDQLLSGVAAIYDAPVRAVGNGRAYFINRLLSDVVIPEAGLVQTSPAARARRALWMTVGLASIALVAVVILGLWTLSVLSNREMQNHLLAAAQNTVQEVRADGIDLVEVRESDPDLEASLSVLRALRNLPGGYAETQKGVPLKRRFGLYQVSDSRAAIQAYQLGLQRVLLPRILLRLERVLNDNQANALSLYEPLKVYLMLGGQAPALDRAAIKAWVEADWAANVYPGEDRAPLRKELGEHLDALLDDPQFGAVWPNRTAPLDGAVVAQSRAAVQTLSLADRAYAILKQRASASGQPGWRADAVLSSGDAKAFAGGDAVLAESVPYFFTRSGFQNAYQVGLQDVQGELEKDLWVLGGEQDRESIRAQMRAVRPGVAGLYARDYIKAWEGVVQSLKPADYFTDINAFGAATGSPSPLKLILLEVRKNTDFSGGTAADAAAKGLLAKLPGPLAGQAAADNSGGVDAGREITDDFKLVHAFVGDGKSPAPVDDFIAKLKAAVTAKGAADRAGGLGGADAAQADLNKAMSELAAASATAPPLVQAYAAGASHQGDQAQVSSAQGAVSGDYDQTVGPACRSVTEQRYPFVTASANDAPTGDLLRVFGANGQMDNFVQQKLRPMVDSSGPIWRWRAGDPVAATLDPTSAGEFQKAGDIRDMLLSGLTLKVEAVGFGGATTAAELSMGGVTYRFDANQTGQRPLQWSPSALPEAHVTLFAGTQKQNSFAFEGPWALFRLMDAARKENAGPQAFKATFGEGASSVTFRIILPGTTNPFSRGGPWSFRCPPKL